MKRLALVSTLAVFLWSGYASAATSGNWDINQLNQVNLIQDGTAIAGTFYGYEGRGQLTGTLEGNILTGWVVDPGRNRVGRCGPGGAWDGVILLKFSADGRSVTGDEGSCQDTHAQLNATSGYRSGTLVSGSPILFGAVATGPVPEIWANLTPELLNITENDALSIVIRLAQSDHAGVNADWWLVLLDVETQEFYHFRLDGSWQPGLNASYQGPIFNLPEFEVLSAYLYPGTYYFYFGVDTVMNGQVDFDNLYLSAVQVNVQ